MAIVECPECGQRISDLALTCPGCGSPTAASRRKGATRKGALFLLILGALLVGLGIATRMMLGEVAADWPWQLGLAVFVAGVVVQVAGWLRSR